MTHYFFFSPDHTWSMMIDSLLDDPDEAAIAANSYCNYHAKGLHYLCLLRDERFTVKLYIFDRTHGFPYLVMPHTHAFGFAHRQEIGKVHNIVFRVCPAKSDDKTKWSLYHYYSALRGHSGRVWHEADLHALGVGLSENRRVLIPGDGFSMNPEEIHTLYVPDEYAAATQIQFRDTVPEGLPTKLYAPVGSEVDCKPGDLYQPMSPHVAGMLIEEFKRKRRN